MQGVQVQSLVRELRSPLACCQKNQQKQYCNKFNKNFKNSPHQKKNSLKKEWLKISVEILWWVSLLKKKNFFQPENLAKPLILLIHVVMLYYNPPWACDVSFFPKVKVKVTQSCPTLCDPMDCQAPLSMEFSRPEDWSGWLFISPGGSSHPRSQTQVSCIAGRFITSWATREALFPKNIC